VIGGSVETGKLERAVAGTCDEVADSGGGEARHGT
jgi:hypothetical protein